MIDMATPDPPTTPPTRSSLRSSTSRGTLSGEKLWGQKTALILRAKTRLFFAGKFAGKKIEAVPGFRVSRFPPSRGFPRAARFLRASRSTRNPLLGEGHRIPLENTKATGH